MNLNTTRILVLQKELNTKAMTFREARCKIKLLKKLCNYYCLLLIQNIYTANHKHKTDLAQHLNSVTKHKQATESSLELVIN